MKAIIIAAGRGKRLGSFTKNTPKPLVDINGSSFFNNTIQKLKHIGISDISAIIGYKKEQFKVFKDIKFYENNNWENNNILHSLFCVKEYMNDDLIISYADIWFHKEPFEKLINTTDDISICVDNDWESYYIGRTEHPISQAENVLYDDKGKIYKIGKHIYQDKNKKLKTGEFMGLMKISKNIINKFIEEFEYLEKNIWLTSPFQNSKTFQNAYLTDFIDYLINKDYNIKCCLNTKGWYEIDTKQDLFNLKKGMNDEKK